MLHYRLTATLLTSFLAVASAAEDSPVTDHADLASAARFQPCDNQFARPIAISNEFTNTVGTVSSQLLPLVNTQSHRQGSVDWSFCAETPNSNSSSIADQPLDRTAPIDIYADHATVSGQDSAIFWGNVLLGHPGELVETPWLLYDLALDTAQAQYGLRYRRGGLTLKGADGLFDLEYNRGIMTDVSYQLTERHARGTAATIRVDDLNSSHYTDATYTTCPAGQDDWLLQAQVLDLDQTRGRGTGRHVTTYFKGVPLFYLPYLSFPISSKRESGFLIPSIGNSSRSGLDLRIPYYWNIAPDHDATFTSRFLTRRGVQLNTEFRYLTSKGHGQIDLEYLPDDQLYGQERGLLSFQHSGDLNPRTHTDIIFGAVSDNNYFQDLGNTLTLTSISYLERRADIVYDGDSWSGRGRAQSFQTIDNSRPFGRLPQIQINFHPQKQAEQIEYQALGEFSNFYRGTMDYGTVTNQNYTGTRLWLQPTISYSLSGLNGFFTPRLTLNHVNYSLQDTAPGLPSSPSLTLPIFSMDAGLFLERNFTLGERSFIQTLEPRFYYLYVPYQEQKNLPIFDTTLLDFEFGQLFRENRFSGPDRMGDANQLAIAVTSRLLDNNSGTQILYGSLGQILYFRDQLVTLDYGTTTVANDGSASGNSDVVAEVGARLGKHWSANSTVQWNQQQGQSEKRAIRLRYQSDQNHIFNFSLRNRRDLLEQTDISTVWPLNRQWRAVARWNYSVKDRQTLESFAGARYDSCCWALQVVARRYVNMPDEAPQNDVMFQLELKGLANIGEKLDSLLTNNIFGYTSER